MKLIKIVLCYSSGQGMKIQTFKTAQLKNCFDTTITLILIYFHRSHLITLLVFRVRYCRVVVYLKSCTTYVECKSTGLCLVFFKSSGVRPVCLRIS